MEASNTVFKSAPGGKLSSSLTAAEILERLRARSSGNVDILKSINGLTKEGAANGTVTFLFELSGGTIESMVHHLNRISFNIKKGLDTKALEEAATGPRGGLYTGSYALLLFMSDSDMRIPDLLKELGITGSKVAELLDTKFNGDANNMHKWIMGRAQGWLIRAKGTQG